jgi:hypothetical protein
MTTMKRIKYVHEGKYAAEVTVDLIEDDGGWAPYLSFEDATRLADVKTALRNGNVAAASRMARVYELKPVSA